MTMPSDAEDLVRRCFDCYRTADRAAIEALLHPDFTFTSPQDDHVGRAAYFERCWLAAGRFASLDLRSIVPDGTGGCFVLYDATWAQGGSLRNVERITFEDGLIASAEVFFGRGVAA